jgi:ABC-2 type transport system ATP-binding protein
MIEVKNLVKRFDAITAVDDVTFSVETGTVLGFLGPNGAGKSTTMRMITGYLPPNSGTAVVCGHDVIRNPIDAKERIGYLPESAALYPEMKVVAFLKFAAAMRGLTGKARSEAIDRVVELCRLQPVFKQSIGTLSKGYRHRTCFAQALIHDPPVLVLDEPTDGLDPNQKHEMRRLIKDMGKDKAIIISTHILEEVDAVCSRVVIIDRGKMVYDGGVPDLLSRDDTSKVRVRIEGKNPKQMAESLYKVDGIRNVNVLETESSSVMLEISVKEDVASVRDGVSANCFDQGWRILELYECDRRLDRVFRKLTIGDEE